MSAPGARAGARRRAHLPRAGRPPVVAAAVALVTALLVGCSSLPTSGPVLDGAGGSDRRGFQLAPGGPRPGADPRALVAGFLAAAVGTEDGFAAARSYLTDASAPRWRPAAMTVVHRPRGLEVVLSQRGSTLVQDAVVDPGAGPVTVTVRATVVATVDERGRYTAAAPGEVVEEELSVVREAGQWRLGAVPDQLLVGEVDFGLVWGARTLYFPDPAGRALVPEVRWLPRGRALAATVATELLLGPSPWLAPAVRPRARPGARLSAASVVVTGGTAQVDLDAGVLDADAQDKGLLVASLKATLRDLPGIGGVVVTAAGGRLSSATDDSLPQASPAVDPAPVLLRDGAPVRLRERQGPLEPVPAPLDDGRDQDAVLASPAVADAPDPAPLAALADSRTRLLRWDDGGTGREVLAVPAPSTLTAPVFDRSGWLWSTATSGGAEVSAVGPDGRRAAVAAPWLSGRTVVALVPSREGARALVVSRVPGEEGDRVEVVGLRRGASGAPRELLAPDPAPEPRIGDVVAAAWVDPSTVAVLGTSTAAVAAERGGTDRDARPRQVFTVTGGAVLALGAPGLSSSARDAEPAPRVVSMACGDGLRTLLLGTDDARVFERAGAGWAPVPPLEGTTSPSFPG